MHSLLIALAVAATLIILLALVLCFKAPTPKHKWLWALFVIFGTVQISLGPFGGPYEVESVSVAFLRPGFVHGEASASSLPSVVLPIGALVFLARRRARGVRDGRQD
jgi:drug/metabolite transporter (DMT)-like permease